MIKFWWKDEPLIVGSLHWAHDKGLQISFKLEPKSGSGLMKISIKETKQIREMLGLSHIVIFGVDTSGQHVSTHGKTMQNAREAAKAGNKLKKSLGWPEDMCRDNPLPRQCKNCFFYKPDYGIHCMNGWSDDGSRGHCMFEPTRIATTEENVCHNFEPK